MKDFVDHKKVTNMKKLSKIIAYSIIIFVLINYGYNLLYGNNIISDTIEFLCNIYIPLILAVLVAHKYKGELANKWKYLIIIFLLFITAYTILRPEVYWGYFTSNWPFCYCAVSIIGEIQTFTCVLEAVLVIYKKYLKVVDLVCLFDLMLGFCGILYFMYTGDIVYVVHYGVFHMLWAVMFAFIYPEEGFTDIFCFKTNLSKTYSHLLIIIAAVIVLISFVYVTVAHDFLHVVFYGNESVFLISLIFLSICFFIMFIGRKLTKEDIDYQKELIESKELNDKLLAEVHHRVKNNLQVIISFLNLQKKKTADESTVMILNDVHARIMAMSIVHSNLLGDYDFGQVNIPTYIDEFCHSFAKLYNETNVGFDLDIDNININLDTIIPLGLIINESLTNSFKYAFPDNQQGNIIIKIKSLDDGYYQLVVGDNGVGCDEAFTPSENSTGIGQLIIGALLSQLDAEYEYDHSNGVKLIAKFKEL